MTLGHAWLLPEYQNWFREINGHIDKNNLSDETIVKVNRLIDRNKDDIRFDCQGMIDTLVGGYIPKRFIEFIPPHLVIHKNNAGTWQALEPNLDLANTAEEYEGLILTLPDGREVHIDERFYPELLPASLGFDMAEASSLASAHGFDLVVSKPLTRIIISFRKEIPDDHLRR